MDATATGTAQSAGRRAGLTDIANGLAWALETTRTPPHIGDARARVRVEREYRELHATLTALDQWLRGWEPVPKVK